MDYFSTFAGRDYFLMLALLVFSRGMDFLSTWIATPNLVLEGNPIAKKLGWKWSLPLNIVICLLLAMWPLSAIVVSTASVLVAARNFQSAWLMRSLGEDLYRHWHIERIQETRVTLYLFCLAGNTLLTAAVGAALIYFSNPERAGFVAFAIGMGMVAYAAAVALWTLVAVWRIHRAARREARRLQAEQKRQMNGQPVVVETCSRPPGQMV